MTEEVKAKSQISNRMLLIILAVLGVVIICLIIGIIVVKINRQNPEESNLDGIISEINTTYSDDILASSEGAAVFSQYLDAKITDGEITLPEAYQYYDEILSKVDKEAYPTYCYYYAQAYLNYEQNLDSAVAVMQKAEPDQDDDNQLIAYYAFMQDIYAVGGDEENANHYSELILEKSSRNTYELEEEGEPVTSEGILYESED